jgi:predicted nucleic acid-binding protein
MPRISIIRFRAPAEIRRRHVAPPTIAPTPSEVLQRAMRYGLTACDAAYLWLAGNLQAALAPFDAALGAVAREHLGGSGTA